MQTIALIIGNLFSYLSEMYPPDNAEINPPTDTTNAFKTP